MLEYLSHFIYFESQRLGSLHDNGAILSEDILTHSATLTMLWIVEVGLTNLVAFLLESCVNGNVALSLHWKDLGGYKRVAAS